MLLGPAIPLGGGAHAAQHDFKRCMPESRWITIHSVTYEAIGRLGGGDRFLLKLEDSLYVISILGSAATKHISRRSFLPSEL